MIARLRARHRAAFVGLAVLVPGLAVVAIRARPSAAISATQIPMEAPSEDFICGLGGDAFETFHDETTLTVFVGEDMEIWTRPATFSRVRMVLLRDWNEPDAVLYWSSTQPTDLVLPQGSQLLGAVGSSPRVEFDLPDDSDRPWLILYSRATGEVVTSVRIPSEPLLPCDMPAAGS